MALLYSKSRHFAKHKTICVTFLYKKPDTLRYAIFYGIFEIGEGGRDNFIGKKLCTLRYIFICNNDELCVTFLYLKFIVWY